MNIINDCDKSLNFEVHNGSRRAFNLFFVPILNLLPSKSKFLIKKSHKSVGEIVNNVTTHVALEVLYKKGHKHHSTSVVSKILQRIWFNTGNSKGVRNRLKIVKRELVLLINKYSLEKRNINIISIASGSARAVIESIKDSNMSEGVGISTIFIDKNPNALKYSESLLKENNLQNRITDKYQWVNGTAGTFIKGVKNNSIDIIEMVGLLDYFDDEKAVDIFRSIYSALNNGGAFITANICPNSEQVFLTVALSWKMIYRTAEDLGKLLINAGFEESEVKIYYEPLKIHCIAIARKK